MPADLWPALSYHFGLHPRDLRIPPEQGGLTWDEITAYVDALADLPPMGGVALWAAE